MIGILALMFTLVGNVYAEERTEVISGPNIRLGKFTVEYPRSVTSSKSTAQGSDTFVYFLNLSKFLSNGTFNETCTRTMTGHLMEDDLFGGDDLVKVYEAEIKNREVKDIAVTTKISGDIESSGDNEAELYMKFMISSCSGDADSTYVYHFFDYYMGIK